MRQPDAQDSFALDSYGPIRYYDRDLTYRLDRINNNNNNKEMSPPLSDFSVGNVAKVLPLNFSGN